MTTFFERRKRAENAGPVLVKAEDARITELKRVFPRITSLSSSAFAASLISQYTNRQLSPKQWACVEDINRRFAKEATKGEIHIPGFKNVAEMLRRAGQEIQWPVIRGMDAEGLIHFNARPRRDANGVTINYKRESDPYNRFGWIVDEGLTMAEFPSAAVKEIGIAWLKELASNPQETAACYGHKTKHCCFCGIVLTDRRSVFVGYGPICADNFGLPWGEKPMGAEAETLARAWEKGA